jgi:hypothetical protein
MSDAHRRDHELIAEAIADDWIADRRLLVHLARDHGLRVEDVTNDGLVPLIVTHDNAHGQACFSDAERSLSEGAQESLAWFRERLQP